jgi:hypothetical protein
MMFIHQRHLDTYIFEHVFKPLFWVLGISFFFFWGAMLSAAPRDPIPPYSHTSSAETASMDKTLDKSRITATPPPRFTLWLTPYLTTRRRKVLALFVYLFILGCQMLEGYWVMVTLARLTVKMYSQWPDHSLWLYGIHSLSMSLLLLMNAAAVGFGGVIVLFQVTCIFELVFFEASGATDEVIRG